LRQFEPSQTAAHEQHSLQYSTDRLSRIPGLRLNAMPAEKVRELSVILKTQRPEDVKR
jgi:hypothetical protein